MKRAIGLLVITAACAWAQTQTRPDQIITPQIPGEWAVYAYLPLGTGGAQVVVPVILGRESFELDPSASPPRLKIKIVTGPQGPAGPAGPTGPQGPAGTGGGKPPKTLAYPVVTNPNSKQFMIPEPCAGEPLVFRNGVAMAPSYDYTRAGQAITFTLQPLAAGDRILVWYQPQ